MGIITIDWFDENKPEDHGTCSVFVIANGQIGSWVNVFAYKNREEFLQTCEKHFKTKRENLAFDEWTGIPEQFKSTSEISDKLWELRELSNEQCTAFEIWLNRFGYDVASRNIPELLEKFNREYSGRWKSKAEFAENCFNETCTVPGNLTIYIDYSHFADDLFRCDYWYDDEYGYVFKIL